MAKNTTIPKDKLDLFQKPALAYLATLMPGGAPQVTPVWIDYDGVYLLVNTAQGRQKDRNMRRDARVGITVQDPDDNLRYLSVIGTVADITTEGAEEHFFRLGKRYTGRDVYRELSPGETRVLFKILPERVFGE